jgi:small subunit ribosomal protein S5
MLKKSPKIQESNLVETLVDVNRVTKVVKGGRNFSFYVLVVVGNQSGVVGIGSGKAKEVTDAKLKASKSAKTNLVKIPLYKGRTIHHDAYGRSGAAKVLLRRAAPGTGVIAGGPMRAIFGCLGIKDIVAKSLGSSNPNAMILATLDALSKLNAPKVIAERRGKNVAEISTTSHPVDND